MTKVYIYESGSDRGGVWEHKTSIDKDALLHHLEEWLKLNDDDERDSYVDDLSEKYDHHKVNAILAILSPPYYFDKEIAQNTHYNNIKNDLPITITCDESDFGVAISKKDAILAVQNTDEDGWD